MAEGAAAGPEAPEVAAGDRDGVPRLVAREMVRPRPHPPPARPPREEGEPDELTGRPSPPPHLAAHLQVLENFKSYAGQQRVGPFHHRFSAVVGPNGSGKSNVIDALLFVCGKRAKQLRQKKVSQLIHKSAGLMDLAHCKVSVVFEEVVDRGAGDGEFDVVPGSEVVVTRMAHRDDRSEYQINGKKSNFNEVTSILKRSGLDLDNNRFLILQGEVESISQMPSKGRKEGETGLLEYLEDIIGTDCFVPQIAEQERRLEALNEDRTSVVHKVKLVEAEKDSLEGQRAEAVAYLAKERELMSWQVRLADLNRAELAARLDALRAQKEGLQARLAEEQRKLDEFQSGSSDADRAHAEKKAQRQKIQAELDRTQVEFQLFIRKDAKLREDLKHCKQKGKKVSQKRDAEAAKRAKMEAETEALEKELPQLEATLAALAERLEGEQAALDAMLAGLKGEQDAVRDRLEKVNLEVAPWAQQIEEAQGEMKVSADELALLRGKEQDKAQKLKDAKAGLKAAEAAQQAKKTELQEREAEAEGHRKRISASRAEADRAGAEEARLAQDVQEAVQAVEVKKAAVNGEKSRNRVVSALMAATSAGRLHNVYGRLGDLGSIEAKYDVAVSTACGALDHIVVESTKDAQRAVEFLRKNDLGRATFLILDQQARLKDAMAQGAKQRAPGNVPRLIDLIKVADERFRAAFYYGVRDTVVCEDLKQAQDVSFNHGKRRRCITLAGQLIETSGTMSGGGGRPQSGRMRLGSKAPAKAGNVDAADLSRAEQQLGEVKEALAEARAAKKRALKDLAEAEKALAGVEKAIKKVAMELETEEAKAAELKKNLKKLEGEAKQSPADAKRIKELEASVATAEAEIAELEGSCAKLREEQGRLQEELDRIGGPKLKKLKSVVKGLADEIASTEEAISDKTVKAAANAKFLAKTAKAAEKHETQIAEIKGEMAQIKQDLEELTQEAESVNESVQTTEELLQQCDQELARLEAESKKHDKAMQAMRSASVELETKLEELAVTMKDEGRRMKHHEKEMATKTKKLEEAAAILKEALGEEDLPDVHLGGEGEEISAKVAEDQLTLIQAALTDMQPRVFHGAIEEYKAKLKDYESKISELEDATAKRNAVRGEYDALRKQRLDQFMVGFNTIALKLKETYQMITLGGDAELILTDSLDPFAEGIEFQVRPPNKTWKNIRNLSGGEKTLSSLALVFALHYFKPNALYVMDEIDAALDFKNVSIVAHYIKERTKNAQFIIISLRNNMFELTDRLVGIYKTEDKTKSITINPNAFAVSQGGGLVPATS